MDKALLAIVEILMKMGKTKKEAFEFVGKEMPKGGIDTIASNVIKPITKRVAGDYPLLGSRITDPTQQGQYGRYNIQVLDTKDRYSLVRQSIEDQNTNWKKTLNFLREGGYTLSKLQEQNLNYNMGVLQRSKLVIKDMTKGLESGGENVEEIYQAFVKNKRFLGNEKTGLSSEGDAILDIIDKTKGDLKKLTKGQDEILAEQKAAKDKRMKKLYEGRPYEGNVGMYRTLGGYHLPKLHEAGIINLDPKIYEALKAGRYHYGNADFFAPDPNRILRYHYGTKIFDDLDKAIEKAALNGDDIALKGPNGMIDFLKKNDYLPFKKDGPKNSLDYMETGELLERVKELDKSSEVIKKGNSPFFKTPDEIMDRVMQNANEKKLYLESFKRIHPERYKLYEKRQSEEPFFALGDVGQNDMFSDLADITKPKDKAKVIGMRPTDETLNKLVEEHAANAEKLKQIDIGDRPGKIILNYSDYTKLTDRNTQIEEIIKNARKVADDEDATSAIGKAISAESTEGKEITKKLFEKIDQASGDNVIKFANPVDEIIASIKGLEPMDAMVEANSVLGKKGKYKNLSDEQINKIIEDTNDHIFQRDLPPDDMAQGGRINFRRGGAGGGKGNNNSPGTTQSGGNANTGPSQGPAGGSSSGGNYGGNRNPQQSYAGRTQSQTASNYGGTGPTYKSKTQSKPKTKTFIEKQIADIKALSTIPYNFSKALFGNYKNPGALTNATLTKGMKNYLENKALKTGKSIGSITNTAYNMPTNTFGLNKFMDPMDIALSTTFGQGNFTTNKTGDINFTGGAYDMDGKFGVVGDFIDQGGLMGSVNKLGESIYDKLNPTLAEGGIIKLAKGGRIGFEQGGLGLLGLPGKGNFDNENYVDKIITDNLKDIKNYFRSKYSAEIADQKFNEYLEGLTYEDMYGTFNEETGNFSGMVESFIGADGERKQIPYPPDKNIDAVGILEALNIDKETVGVNPDYNVNDRKPFDRRFFQNENFTGTDNFYVEGRDV